MKIWSENKLRLNLKDIDMERIPQHIAIIMDGNGRWAARRGMSRTRGHRAGVEALRGIVKACDQIGVRYLTVYAFSTENWKRPLTEIGILMSLLKEYVSKELDELNLNNVQINTLGDIEQLAQDVRKAVLLASEKTKKNTGLVFNLALNYGGRAEIIRAVQRIVKDTQDNSLNPKDLNEDLFENYLYTAGCPDPELLIRTSGELRLSNFLLWQAAYSEIVVVDELWPDFNEKCLLKAIHSYQHRERRFGGIKKVEE